MKWLNLSSIDWFLLIGVFILLLFSLITLFSINFEIFRTQLLFLGFSVIIFFIFSQLNTSFLRYYSLPIYVISLILLLIVLIFGVESRGSIRWLEFIGVRIQFSEILKPFLAIVLANYLANLKNYSFRSFLIVLVFLAPLAFLIFFQPDLGNSLIYAFVVLGVMLIYGFPIRWFLGGLLIWLSSLPFFWVFLHDYQRQRILTFINPSRDPLGTSYNAIQAVIAVGSGMFLGRGLGQGTQAGLRFLPERHTDFIFATISEELGFLGSVIIVFSFTIIFYRLFIIIRGSDDKFAKSFGLIVFMIIFVHFFINIGMNIGIVPIVGVTLPFVSYGGSSLLGNFILLGLLFAINRKKKQKILEIG